MSGLHLTLIQGRGVLPHRHIPHLVNTRAISGKTRWAPGSPIFFPAGPAGNQAELEAQVEKMLPRVCLPEFLNGHLNIHLHPGCLARGAASGGRL